MQNKNFYFIFPIICFCIGFGSGYLYFNSRTDDLNKKGIESAIQTNNKIGDTADSGLSHNNRASDAITDSIDRVDDLQQGNTNNKDTIGQLKDSTDRLTEIFRQIENQK